MLDARDVPKRLHEISIELTSKCNLTCTMCSVWKGKRDGMPRGRIVSLLREARTLGAKRFTPCGAEVFMRKDCVGILEDASSLGFENVSVVTNGMLIRHHVARLAENKSLTLNISIDGPENVHDALRGKGSYEAALGGLRAATGAGIPTTIKGIILPSSIETATHIISLAVEYGLSRVSFQPFQPEIAWAVEDHSEWTFPHEERAYLVDKLEEIVNEARLKGIDIYTEALFPEFPDYIFEGLRPIPPQGCFLPSRFILIDGRGNTYPCFFMREKSMGNVMEGVNLIDIWHGPVHRKMQTKGINRTCPGCLAGCSDVDSFNLSVA